MKRILFSILIALLPLIGIQAQQFEVGGLWYEVNNSSACSVVSSLNAEYKGEIVIPQQVKYNGRTYNVTGLGADSFRDCHSLTGVTIPEGVVSIGDRCFENCQSLKSLIIPEGVLNIGARCFWNCSSMAMIQIPSTVAAFGDNEALIFNSGAIGVIVNKSVTPQENLSLESLSDWKLVVPHNSRNRYEKSPAWSNLLVVEETDSIFCRNKIVYQTLNNVECRVINPNWSDEVTQYKGVVTVPQSVEYNGSTYAVTQIARCAFKQSRITAVNLPESITYMGEQAFWEAENLQKIKIPSKVRSIETSTFEGCYQLSSVHIHANVSQIGDKAFWRCHILEEVINDSPVPQDVTETTFASYGTLIVPKGSESLYASNGVWQLFKIDGLNVFKVGGLNYILLDSYSCMLVKPQDGSSYSGDIVVPSKITYQGNEYNVTQIIDRCFTNSVIRRLIFDNEFITDFKSCVYCCENLVEVVLPENLVTLGYRCFGGCSLLTSITLPESVTELGEFCFKDCISLKSINIPGGVSTLDYGCFDGCTSLQSVLFSEGVQILGIQSFIGCSSLTEVVLPESLSEIYECCFQNCTSLKHIRIPENVKVLGLGAFAGCSSLNSVTFVGSECNLSAVCFDACDNLKDVYVYSYQVPVLEDASSFSAYNNLHVVKGTKASFEAHPIWSKFNMVDDIEDYRFDFAGLKFEIVKDGVCRLIDNMDANGNGVYAGDVVIPAEVEKDGNKYKVTELAAGSFALCGSLKSVVIPEGVKSIGHDCFLGASSLVSVSIPKSVTSIGSSSFDGCSSLKEVNIPEGVTVLNDWCFNGCSSLPNITIPEGVTRIGHGCFSACSSLKSFAIPQSVVSLGDNCLSSCSSLTSITIPGSVQYMGAGCFHDCESLIDVNIKEGIVSMSNECFANCKNLKHVSLPKSLVLIGEKTFLGCEKLVDVELLTGTKNLPNKMFGDCRSLASIELPQGIESLDASAFENAGLRTIEIPQSVKAIGDRCFYGCTKLTKVVNYAYTPQLINETAFSRYDTLHVSLNAINSFKNAEGWKNFKNIEYERVFAHNGYEPFFNNSSVSMKKASYTRFFSKKTAKGTSAGWETLVVPFDVYRIESEDGRLFAPFGSSAQIQGIAYPFWLAEYSESGLRMAKAIHANVPYLICMPNDDDYGQEYAVNCNMTFSSNNVTLHATDNLRAVSSTDYDFMPTYQNVESSMEVYALNDQTFVDDNGKAYLPGSVFVRNIGAVRPFEAYFLPKTPNGASRRYIPLFGDGDETNVEIVKPDMQSENVYYNLSGQRTMTPQRGINIVRTRNGFKKVVTK